MRTHATEPVSAEELDAVLDETIRSHRNGGRCRQCPNDDDTRCPQLRWARVTLANRPSAE